VVLAPVTFRAALPKGLGLSRFVCAIRTAAKGGKAKDDDSAPTPAPDFDSAEFDGLMIKAVDAMKKDFEKLRTGQVSAGRGAGVCRSVWGTGTDSFFFVKKTTPPLVAPPLPSAGMLDHVKVAAYGGHVPLAQVGQVRLRDPKTLVVNVFDPSVCAFLVMLHCGPRPGAMPWRCFQMYHIGIGWHVTPCAW
jgi:hypothetical protein